MGLFVRNNSKKKSCLKNLKSKEENTVNEKSEFSLFLFKQTQEKMSLT